MADETTDNAANQTGQAGDAEGAKLRILDAKAHTAYSNFCIVTSTPEEALLNFGINLMIPNKENEVRVQVSDRIVMSYASAKRLAITLSNLIQRYEAANGVIEINRGAAEGQAQAGEMPDAAAN